MTKKNDKPKKPEPANEDARVEIPVTLYVRGPVFLAKLLERGMAQELAHFIEEGIRNGTGSYDRGGDGASIVVWNVTIDSEKERRLTSEEIKKEGR